VLETTVDHLLQNVLGAAADYEAAEEALTRAYNADSTPAAWESAARFAKRRAAEVAIAIDALTDRCFTELGRSKPDVRTDVSALCAWPGSGAPRSGAHNRVRGVSNAYKHQDLTDHTLPIRSNNDVLVVGSGWGMDGCGVGKYGGLPEVLVSETAGEQFKFSGDVLVAIAAWFRFLVANGAVLPAGPFRCCGIQVHP
jgi:hypothetical protein